jgi:SAM-dependent methyltransferase
MPVNYHHASNVHTQAGPQAALPILFADTVPLSLLDVGCGTGTWLNAALALGVPEVLGIDGVDIPQRDLLIPAESFQCVDLTDWWDLGHRFDAALCLEVAEHLDTVSGDSLIASLTRHSDVVYFSAASPGQPGEHHVNCQWPSYWQERFNSHGFVCSDQVRWDIWGDTRIEPWYRQNMFTARRDPDLAGTESRIKPVAHPDLVSFVRDRLKPTSWPEYLQRIENGEMSASWYLTIPMKVAYTKFRRRLTQSRTASW